MHREYLDKLLRSMEQMKIDRNGQLTENYEAGIQTIIDFMTEVKQKERQLFFCGNGGSAAIASHMCADYMKNGGMRTYSLYDNAVTTCMGNDYGYEYIFSRPLSFLAQEGDLLVAISSSGNSQNIVNAVETVRKKGAGVITLTGFEPDNRLRKLGDINIYIPVSHYGMVESIHNLLLQQVVDAIIERDGIML